MKPFPRLDVAPSLAAVIFCVGAAVAACGGKPAEPKPSGTPGAAAMPVDGPVPTGDGPVATIDGPVTAIDGSAVNGSADGIAAPVVLPAALAEFETFLAALERDPPSAGRSKRTCAIATDDRVRGKFVAVWKLPRPASTTKDEWEAAIEAFSDTEYDIGNLCQDLDWDDDVSVLEKLRTRFDRLVALERR